MVDKYSKVKGWFNRGRERVIIKEAIQLENLSRLGS